MANGGAPNGPPRCCPSDRDGNLMPLSPAVRSRYDSTVQHCTHSPLTFLPSPASLPVENPFELIKGGPCDVGRGRTPSRHLPTSKLQAYYSFLRSRARTRINPDKQQEGFTHPCGPKLGKISVCSRACVATICSLCSLRSPPNRKG